MSSSLSKRVKRLAILKVLDELTEKEFKIFEKELDRTPALKSYIHELESALKIIALLPTPEPTEDFLMGQRNLLRGRIDALHKESFLLKSINVIRQALPSVKFISLRRYRISIPVIAFIIFTLVIVIFFLVPPATPTIATRNVGLVERKIKALMQNQQLTVTKIQQSKDGSGVVTFQLEAKEEFSYSGGITNALVVDLLDYVLLNDENPGRRLQSVKILTEVAADEKSKQVLVSALLTDVNPGIRLRAIRHLKKYGRDRMIKEACMKALLEDENSAIRMTALNILAQSPGTELYPILQVVSQLDNNEYIRSEAARLLSGLSENM